jgi:hypothetical protein
MKVPENARELLASYRRSYQPGVLSNVPDWLIDLALLGLDCQEAGERRGIEKATADYERRADERCAEADACDAAGDSAGAAAARELASHYRLTAHELRALGRPA